MADTLTESAALFTSSDPYTSLVSRVLAIESVQSGDQKAGYLVRYSGRLVLDSQVAYEQLSTALKPLQVTPLFRNDQGRHVVLLVPGVIEPGPVNIRLSLLLFGLTFLCVMYAGGAFTVGVPIIPTSSELILVLVQGLLAGLPFAVSLLAILGAHEFGHYAAGRIHHAAVSLPYFLPFPLSPFGTLGAFINMKAPPKNRRVLLDIAIAGPLAGLAVAIPVLLVGLWLSEVTTIDVATGQSVQFEGNSILYLLAKLLVFGQLLPAPASYAGLSPVLYWIRYFFTGQPLPLGGVDVSIHPVAWAGWAGLLVTSLNLIPAGQLDGGHLLYGLLGRRVRYLLPVILVLLVGMGFVWSGWWLWAALILVFGRSHAEPLDQITPLDPVRKLIAAGGLLIFFLVFTPVPLIQVVAGM